MRLNEAERAFDNGELARGIDAHRRVECFCKWREAACGSELLWTRIYMFAIDSVSGKPAPFTAVNSAFHFQHPKNETSWSPSTGIEVHQRLPQPNLYSLDAFHPFFFIRETQYSYSIIVENFYYFSTLSIVCFFFLQ